MRSEPAFPAGLQRQVTRVGLYLHCDLGVAVWDGGAWKTVVRRTAQFGAPVASSEKTTLLR